MSSAIPAPPGAAVTLFGPAIALAERFTSLLATHGVERGLIGPREVPRLWERHLLNCGALAELIPDEAEVVDLGSGAGLPGLVIAMLRPQVRMTLLEPMLRRTVFLGECTAELGLGHVTVCRGRAEDMAGVIRADIAISRAVAPLGRLAELSAGLVRPGGTILALKGDQAQSELDQAGTVLRRLGVRSAEVLKAGQGIVEPPATVVRLLAAGRARGR